jgi:iron complex outermembrane receptor protein
MKKSLRIHRIFKNIMHITITQTLLSVLFLSVTFANGVYSQESLNKKISLTIKNQSLKATLAEIEKSAEIRFIYSSSLINTERKLSGNYQDKTLETILNQLLTPLGIRYKATGNQIMLKPALRTSAILIPVIETTVASIQGVIKDVTGEGLPGVSVTVKGSLRGTLTEGAGKFTINAEIGETLVMSYIGYKSQEIVLNSTQDLSVTLEESTSTLNEVVVIGSRGKPRTDVERPVPVDVISAKEIQATGQTDLGQMIQFSSPSFNSAKYGVNGTTNYAEPATLRGMSPDQSLVLINGKRRHQFAALNLNVSPGAGTVVTDMNSIPSLALSQVEVLRDGAAAQYGSDAIAGIVNLALKETVNEGTLETQAGIHKAGDGFTFKTALNYGLALGKKGGFVNFTVNYFRMNQTNRTDNYTGRIYNADATKDAAVRATRGVYPKDPFPIGVYGSNQNDTYQTFVNAGLPLGKNWKFYTFGGTSRKNILAYGFFRPAYGANSVPEIYPDGYVPELPGTSIDYSVVGGLKRTTKDGWNLDFSYGYGHNHLDLSANGTTNPSMGIASPTNFYVGRNAFGQSIFEGNVVKNIRNIGSLKSLNLAFGTAYRTDYFDVTSGSKESYEVGPLAFTLGKAVGSSGRPGIAPNDEVSIKRSNIGIYADVESDVTDRLLVATALRFENYSDFGSNISGKIAARYKITDNFSVRGSVNKGFRAPSLAQVGNRVNTSTVQNGQIIITQQLSNDNPGLAALGIEQPKAETSYNYNVGLTATALNGALLFTLDAFLINIQDRIVITDRLQASRIPAVKSTFPNSAEVRFFTNHIDTRTRGIDFVTSYKKSLDQDSRINASFALTLNETNVLRQKETPVDLLKGVATPFQLLGDVALSLIEVAQPRSKMLGSFGYNYKNAGFIVRATRFGSVQSIDSNKEIGDNGVQTFSAKTLTDLSVNYTLSKSLMISLGSNNIFDIYPDRWDIRSASYSSGQIPFTRNANQFGFNGAFYYLNATISL